MRAMTARLASPADNALLHSIVGHPALREGNTPDNGQPFDPAAYTAHPTNFALIVEGGCFVARCVEAGAYVIHTNFLPEARGANALRESRSALEFAFLATPAEVLYTMAPAYALPTVWFAHQMGFIDTYRRANAWLSKGHAYDLQHMQLDLDDWLQASKPCSAAGAEFHALLGERVNHAHDSMHDSYVGAAVLMLANGQTDKAVRTYGRWARTCGYEPIAVHSREPLVIDVGTHLAHVDGTSYVLEKKTCPQD